MMHDVSAAGYWCRFQMMTEVLHPIGSDPPVGLEYSLVPCISRILTSLASQPASLDWQQYWLLISVVLAVY